MKEKIANIMSKILYSIAIFLYKNPHMATTKMPENVYEEITKKLEGSKYLIDLKISKAYQSMNETSILLNELQSLLKERTESLNKLSDEYKRYSELALIEQKKAEAIVLQLKTSINEGKNMERWIGFLINIIAGIILFVLGIWASPFVSKLIFK